MYPPTVPSPSGIRWSRSVVTLIAAAVALSGCGSSLFAASSTTTPPSNVPAGTASTAPLNGEVAVAFPVVTCTTSTGASLGSQGWKPSILVAPIPTTLVNKVEFYSDGTHILLGPTGWSCAQTQVTGGGTGLVVYPPTLPIPPVDGAPGPGTQGVFATFDTTGHVQGILLVCPFFTLPTWQTQEAKCTGFKPNGEQSSMPTPDLASVTDPAGIVGSLEGSGGVGPVTGTVIFPQVEPAVTNGSSVSVAEESCSLPDASLCPTVLSDFDVREFPVPGSTYQPSFQPSPKPSVPTTTNPAATTAPKPASPTTVAAAPATTAPTTTAPTTGPASTQSH